MWQESFSACHSRRSNGLDRFESTTLGFFEKYGIRWTTLVGPDNQTLTYMLEWESMAERVQADPEWIAKRNASEAEKRIVLRIENQFVAPTAFSALR
jgi:hypothetical protein